MANYMPRQVHIRREHQGFGVLFFYHHNPPTPQKTLPLFRNPLIYTRHYGRDSVFMTSQKKMTKTNKQIEWGVPEPTEDEFRAFLKTKKMTGLPKGYHTPEIFD